MLAARGMDGKTVLSVDHMQKKLLNLVEQRVSMKRIDMGKLESDVDVTRCPSSKRLLIN
jgi:hypothetical protein